MALKPLLATMIVCHSIVTGATVDCSRHDIAICNSFLVNFWHSKNGFWRAQDQYLNFFGSTSK